MADGCCAASARRSPSGFSDGIPANLSDGTGAHAPDGSGTALAEAILALPPDAVDAALPIVLGRRGLGEGPLETLALPAASGKAGGEASARGGGAPARGVALLAAVPPPSLPPCQDLAGGHEAALGSSVLAGTSAPSGENLVTTAFDGEKACARAPPSRSLDLAPAAATPLRAERPSTTEGLGSRLLLVLPRGVRWLARPAGAPPQPTPAGAAHSAGGRDALWLEVRL
mmetsp:Transcript_115242/g.312841  ORF Transcript_115242/g.312841 Transcript_115242/m.312841 type:complete len:228 (+) Transcript_115242:509-1192(+)